MKQTLDLGSRVMDVLGIKGSLRDGRRVGCALPCPRIRARTQTNFAISTPRRLRSWQAVAPLAQLVMETEGLEWEEEALGGQLPRCIEGTLGPKSGSLSRSSTKAASRRSRCTLLPSRTCCTLDGWLRSAAVSVVSPKETIPQVRAVLAGDTPKYNH